MLARLLLLCKKRRTAQMTTNRLSKNPVWETIRQGKFFKISEDEIIKQIGETFTSELSRLKYATVNEGGSPPSRTNNCLEKPPHHLKSYMVPIMMKLIEHWLVFWLYVGFKTMITSVLQKANLDALGSISILLVGYANFFEQGLKSPEDLFALVVSMVINDMGKDPNLEEDYFHETHVKLPEQNHDSILLEAAKVGLVPCLDMLDEPHRSDVMLGLELGSELNAGQLAQAESVPINLEGLLHMRGREHAFELKFMEQILDVAGAAGHIDSSGAKNLIEPVFQGFKTVHEVSLDIIEGRSSLRQGYDKVLTKRGNMLSVKGFRRLSVSDREERALLRLLTMGRTADLEQAELFSKAFHALDKKNKEILVNGLNIDGNVNETAVLPYYMPAIISETLETTRNSSEDDQRRALTSLMRYLARVLENSSSSTLTSLPEDPDTERASVPGIVIEHNMMKAREVIGSIGFRNNPDKLDDLDIPKDSYSNVAGQVIRWIL